MNILVTGGAGFIASHIVDAYLNAGHRVVVVDNLSTGREKNLNPRAEFIRADVRDRGIGELFQQYSFDVVNHHAAQMDVRLSVKDPIFDADNNIIGMINLLQNCVQYQVKKVIFASSGGVVYGEQDYFPADEEHPQRPVCPYGVAKLTGEKYLYYYALTFGLRYTAFRYANVYGPRQNPHGEAGVIAIFLEKLLKNEQPIINGDGQQTRDFVYIDDVVSANVLALTAGDNHIFNIGTGTETSINTIYHLLNEISRADKPIQYGTAKSGEQRRSVIAIEKAKMIGWSPCFELRDGLERTVSFFREQENQGHAL
ncbi:MAG: NAD-dependent epimerase/dehydratase family protein [Calditrichaeota bacterium]|nr:MAG: NAD-dependent epimerase/dehydratase family protein [Calditrichota bacterium]